jgi:hypothetical protein
VPDDQEQKNFSGDEQREGPVLIGQAKDGGRSRLAVSHLIR